MPPNPPTQQTQGDENPYDFAAMRAHCPVWHQFHSDNDPFIPLDEAERVRAGLGLPEGYYRMLPGRSHFFDYPFPELLELVTALATEDGPAK